MGLPHWLSRIQTDYHLIVWLPRSNSSVFSVYCMYTGSVHWGTLMAHSTFFSVYLSHYLECVGLYTAKKKRAKHASSSNYSTIPNCRNLSKILEAHTWNKFIAIPYEKFPQATWNCCDHMLLCIGFSSCVTCPVSEDIQFTVVDKIGSSYAKRSLMSWVVVIPKEGRARMAAPVLLFEFFWYNTDF